HVRSDWDRMKQTIEDAGRWPGVFVSLPPPGTDLQRDVDPAVCPEPTFIGATEEALGRAAEIVFVLDRTGSMAASDTPPVSGITSPSRLDFVKSAVAMVVDQFGDAYSAGP